MAKILVCQHVPYEILGTLDPLCRDAGFRIRYMNFGRFPDGKPSLENYDGLVILGGPMNVDQVREHPHLKTEIHLVEAALKKNIPVLGICLGAQILAKALGAQVKKNREKEIGWYDVFLTEAGRKNFLLKHFQKTEKIFQWHGETFAIPNGATHLASSALCESQAFSYGEKVYGFQFHLEVDEPMIERWLKVAVHKKELAQLKGKIHPNLIRQETPKHINSLKNLSDKTFGEFLKLFGKRKKARRLSSR